MASRSSGGGTVLASGIRTREKKDRKPYYSDEWALGDDEIEGHHTFSIDEKIRSPKFEINFVKDLSEYDFDLRYIQKNGFNWPLLFKTKEKLDIVIPNEGFTINDVRLSVGSRRMLDVMDVNTQKNVEMTMKDWQRYYESPDKDKLLNVISLEFSHTRLDTLVEAPHVVRQIDWVEKVWPRHLKESQTESTNVLEDMMYPKVQKYCLMSVKGCYTDFHIDFGGTSVWYHILKGKKIFWLIPPSERNLQLYEQWVLSGKQSDIFFGDTVDKCARIELFAGNTFFIPTGWIHAVFTPEDSLVFGGNFLHSFGIEKQLRVAHVEDTTHVPLKFRYPFFTEMLWYLLERYVHVLLDRSHLELPVEERAKYEKHLSLKADNNNELKEHTHLTQYELHGLKAIVMYLHSLPTSKKCVPELIKNPINLIRDVRTVVEKHRYDSPDLAITNKCVLDWWPREGVKFTIKRPVSDGSVVVKKRRQSLEDSKMLSKYPPNMSKIRHRRVRCRTCEACTKDDCRACAFCRDMTKYGGPGTMKQTCKSKKCSQPSIPVAVVCYLCQCDGWGRVNVAPQQKHPDAPNNLLECSVCYKISHPKCMKKDFKDVSGIVNDDLPNSWECPECVRFEYNINFKHNRMSSGRISSAGSDSNTKSPPASLPLDKDEIEAKVKAEPLPPEGDAPDGDKICPVDAIKEEKLMDVEPVSPRMPTWEQLQARVKYPLVRPKWVVRPAPSPEASDDELNDSGSESDEGSSSCKPLRNSLMKEILPLVFRYLTVNELLVAMRVCRQWAKCSIHPSLWQEVSLMQITLETTHLHGIVRRQPLSLIFDWCRINADQFSWLIARLPQIKKMRMHGSDWRFIYPLTSPYCPCLTHLDISFCAGIDDYTLLELLSPPRTHRPGHRDDRTRLRHLSNLSLAGTQVGDRGVQAIASSLPFLTHLDLSSCPRVTEVSPAILALPSSLVCHSITSLDLRGCDGMSPICLPSLGELPLLSRLSLHPCDRIPLKAIKVWGAFHKYSFDEEFTMTRTPPKPADMADLVLDRESPPISLSSEKSDAKDYDQHNESLVSEKSDSKVDLSPASKEQPHVPPPSVKSKAPEIKKGDGDKENKTSNVVSCKSGKYSQCFDSKDKVDSSKRKDAKLKKSSTKGILNKDKKLHPKVSPPSENRKKEAKEDCKDNTDSKSTPTKLKKEKKSQIHHKREEPTNKSPLELGSETKCKPADSKPKVKSDKKTVKYVCKVTAKGKQRESIPKTMKTKFKSKTPKQRSRITNETSDPLETEAASVSDKTKTPVLKITLSKTPTVALKAEDSLESDFARKGTAYRRSERSNKGKKYSKHELMAKKMKKLSGEALDNLQDSLTKEDAKLLNANVLVEIPKREQVASKETCDRTGESLKDDISDEDIAEILEDPLRITSDDLCEESKPEKPTATSVKGEENNEHECKNPAPQESPSNSGNKSQVGRKKMLRKTLKNRSMKIKKDIMTRSKRQRRQVEESRRLLSEEENSPNSSKDTSSKGEKRVIKCPKASKREREFSVTKVEGKEEVLKIRKILQVQSSSQYISKLRVKSTDGDSSPCSSSEEKPKLKRRSSSQEHNTSERKSRLERSQEQKTELVVKHRKKLLTDAAGGPNSTTSIKKKEPVAGISSQKKSKETESIPAPSHSPSPSPSLKKRKERKGSSSSSSPSSPVTKVPPSELPFSKNLKESDGATTGKIFRRRSDTFHSSPLPSSGSASSSASSSRDRPERQHRSPRRLSMSQ